MSWFASYGFVLSRTSLRNGGAVFASIFVVATATMRTMIPLRIFGILTNLVLIAFSIPTPPLSDHGAAHVLLPLNVYRLREMLLLVRDVKKSVNSDLSMAWLKPFMTERNVPGRRSAVLQGREGRGDVLHRQRPLPAGRVRHRAADRRHRRRTRHAVAVEQAHPDTGMPRGRLVLSVTYDQVEELYVQNPEFGFYFLRLASARLFENIATLESGSQPHVGPGRGRARRRQHRRALEWQRRPLLRFGYLLSDLIGDPSTTSVSSREPCPRRRVRGQRCGSIC